MNAYRTMKWLAVIGMVLIGVLLIGVLLAPAYAAPASAAALASVEPAAAQPVTDTQAVTTTEVMTYGPPIWPTTQQPPLLNPCTQCQCPDILNDSNYTSQHVFDNQRGYEYAEAFVTCPTGAQAGIFNTTGYNIRPDNSRNSIPNSIFQSYSDDAVAQDYGATSVFMEETRYWLMDKLRIYLGNNVRNLAGLDTRFGAFTNVAPGPSTGSAQAYQIATVTRDSTFYFDAGQPVFILEDPNGMAFIQQSWVQSAGPFQDPTIGDRLTLPDGWSWRTETLTEDLTINGITAGGLANQWKVLQDSFGDSYSGCWEADGQSSCNYLP